MDTGAESCTTFMLSDICFTSLIFINCSSRPTLEGSVSFRAEIVPKYGLIICTSRELPSKAENI